MKTYVLYPGKLTLEMIRDVLTEKCTVTLDLGAAAGIHAAMQTVQAIVQNGETVYGINTGFGQLATTKINADDLQQLQRNLVLSHAAGTGELLADDIVRLMMLLKLNSLARGYSGVRVEVINSLLACFNARVYPCIPAQGSVGASGDLAPLAHLAMALIGEGEVYYQQKRITAIKGLKKAKVKPLVLAPKEGLALLNGMQASTAIAIKALMQAEDVFATAIVAGSLSVEAASGSHVPFDDRIHAVRGHQGQRDCASLYRNLLENSEINASHAHCKRVQDPYSLRCQPQVMGACLEHIRFASQTFLTEANAVSDNPLVFADDAAILSGGNFHGEPIALAADTLALAIAEIGAMSERRIALLTDKHLSGLPAFLVQESGLNSGFMMAHVTASALASENKSLAHPRSIDSLPTSANQEDHVSMAANAVNRLFTMLDNTTTILAIELLASAQGIDFHKPHKTSALLQPIHRMIRERVPFYETDRFMAADIDNIKSWLLHDDGYTVMRDLTSKAMFAIS